MTEAWFLIAFLVGGNHIDPEIQAWPKAYSSEQECANAAADPGLIVVKKGYIAGLVCERGWTRSNRMYAVPLGMIAGAMFALVVTIGFVNMRLARIVELLEKLAAR